MIPSIINKMNPLSYGMYVSGISTALTLLIMKLFPATNDRGSVPVGAGFVMLLFEIIKLEILLTSSLIFAFYQYFSGLGFALVWLFKFCWYWIIMIMLAGTW